jgi:hypothetical protein
VQVIESNDNSGQLLKGHKDCLLDPQAGQLAGNRFPR